MKNFTRILKVSWKYKRKIIVSLMCAFTAAILYGLNFTAVFPLLNLLDKRVTLQQWIDDRLVLIEKDIEKHEKEVDGYKAKLRDIEKWDPGTLRDREEHLVTNELRRHESRLSADRNRLWRHSALKQYVIRHLPNDLFKTIAIVLVCVVIAVALRGVFEFFQEYYVGIVINRTILDMRNEFFRKAIHQDMRQISEGGSADLMARVTNDMDACGNGMKLLYGRVVAEPLRALACVSIACWISWQLTVLFLVTVPLAVYFMTSASKKMKKASRRLLDRMSSLYKVMQETIQGIRIVKAFTMEPYERRRFHQVSRDYCEKSIKVVRIDALSGPLVEITAIVAVSIALLAGAYLVLTGERRIWGMDFASEPMEVATLLWLYAQLIGMADPVRKLSSVYTKIQTAISAADRIYTVMDKVPNVNANSDGPRLERHTKEIEFQNVCFSYSPERQVLTNICLRVQANETIGIVGANGSGKSTLLNLLPRFYDPDHGTILIDGLDVRKMNLRSLRKQIALVSQDPILFDDTILNNIRYGSRRATKEQIEDAAKKAFAHDFIMAKGGYDTQLGDLGSGLSGGERQRIALARAILRDPSVLILDEFSSAIDPVSDRLIHDALRDFRKGRTTFFITHKMHTLEMADRIVVIDQHQIADTGTLQELLTKSEVFRNLYDAQLAIKAA